ncbi:MAG: alpha/beta hydrolase family protein [Steroidobacterales bacterium]
MRCRSFAVACAAITLSGCAHVRVSAEAMLKPDDPPAAARLAPGYAIEESSIARNGRTVAITYAHRPGNGVVILFCGGDSFRRSREGGSVLTALARQDDVVLFDYPGYGDSTGHPEPATLLDNARAAAAYVTSRKPAEEQARVLYGFSLGGVIAAQLAGEQSFDGIVLESTAPDVTSWAHSQIPWFAKPFVRIELAPALARIDNVAALRSFAGRVLILAGGRDKRSPPDLSRSFARQLATAQRMVELRIFPRAVHGEIYRDPEYPIVLEKFLARLRGPR